MTKYAEAYIEGRDIVIRVAISALPDAVRAGGDLGVVPLAVVTDAQVFAKGLVRQMNRESEDGTTPIHRLLDEAVTAAFEAGDEGIEPADAKGEMCEHAETVWGKLATGDYEMECIRCGLKWPGTSVTPPGVGKPGTGQRREGGES